MIWDDNGNVIVVEGELIFLDVSVELDVEFVVWVVEFVVLIEELKVKVIGLIEVLIDGDCGFCWFGEC